MIKNWDQQQCDKRMVLDAKNKMGDAKVIKNLNTTYCKVNAQDTTEEKLTTKIKKPKVAAKAKEGQANPRRGPTCSRKGPLVRRAGSN